jgi:hypothetical protein
MELYCIELIGDLTQPTENEHYSKTKAHLSALEVIPAGIIVFLLEVLAESMFSGGELFC